MQVGLRGLRRFVRLVGCLVIDESSVSFHMQEDRELRKGISRSEGWDEEGQKRWLYT